MKNQTQRPFPNYKVFLKRPSSLLAKGCLLQQGLWSASLLVKCFYKYPKILR
jgi:hypothetical protein